MYKITKTYTDYGGTERTEDFYFNLTKAELMEMQLGEDGGLDQKIRAIIATKSSKDMIKIFKELVINAYGEKSADGRRFIKNDEIREAFMQTEAYSDIFVELATDSDKATAFLKGIVPYVPEDSFNKELGKALKEV